VRPVNGPMILLLSRCFVLIRKARVFKGKVRMEFIFKVITYLLIYALLCSASFCSFSVRI